MSAKALDVVANGNICVQCAHNTTLLLCLARRCVQLSKLQMCLGELCKLIAASSYKIRLCSILARCPFQGY